VDGACHKLFRRVRQLGFAALMVIPASAQTASTALKTDIVFSQYSARSNTEELVRRLYSPLTALRINQEAQRAGHTLRGQPIDLSRERYSIYVPEHHPHALLVFIPN
jgi:hypothetical protein